jgi:hypothetical protein
VHPNDKDARGWMPMTDAALDDGADIVTIAGLNIDQRARAMDSGKQLADLQVEQQLAHCRLGIRKIRTKGSGEVDIEEWLCRVTPSIHIIILLGRYIEHTTLGIDPRIMQQMCTERRNGDGFEDEEDASDEASKSE